MNDFVRLCALKTIADAAKAEYDQLRARLRDELTEGDRRTAVLDDGLVVGAATHVQGKAPELGIVDRQAFLEYVKDHHDEALELKVKDWFVQQALQQAKTTGEMLPGVGLLPAGSSYVMAKMTPVHRQSLVEAWNKGLLAPILEGAYKGRCIRCGVKRPTGDEVIGTEPCRYEPDVDGGPPIRVDHEWFRDE